MTNEMVMKSKIDFIVSSRNYILKTMKKQQHREENGQRLYL